MEKDARSRFETLTEKQKDQILKVMSEKRMGAMQAIDYVLKSKQY